MKQRSTRKDPADLAKQPASTSSDLTTAEQGVLTTFRKFLMTPGKMLCFSKADLEIIGPPIAKLIQKGLLVSERFAGGYSLTDNGFASMKKSA